MGILVYYSLYFFDRFVDTHRVVGLFTQTMGAIGVGALTYFISTYLFGCEETKFVLKKFKFRFLKKLVEK